MGFCYWCGKEVLVNDGAKEHIVPKVLLNDVQGDLSNLIIPKQNAHRSCNNFIGNNCEHDFCQMLFHYAFNDSNARKHNDSKIRNLKSKNDYTRNQFSKMKLVDGVTKIAITDNERDNVEKVLTKIIKGLFFKQTGKFLDLEKEYDLKLCWNTFNLEYDDKAVVQAKNFLDAIGSQEFIGNGVFKYRVVKAFDANSSLWELVFYNRFPAYVYVINFEDKEFFANKKIQ